MSSRYRPMSSSPTGTESPSNSADRGGETVGKRDAARVHTDERDSRDAVVTLDDLVSDAADRAADVVRAQDDMRVDRGRLAQRKTPTPEREGSLARDDIGL